MLTPIDHRDQGAKPGGVEHELCEQVLYSMHIHTYRTSAVLISPRNVPSRYDLLHLIIKGISVVRLICTVMYDPRDRLLTVDICTARTQVAPAYSSLGN
jgi:hypothetical protein